jgi:hypothetical protein
MNQILFQRHCEERSDEAFQKTDWVASLITRSRALFAREPEGANREERLAGLSAMTGL